MSTSSNCEASDKLSVVTKIDLVMGGMEFMKYEISSSGPGAGAFTALIAVGAISLDFAEKTTSYNSHFIFVFLSSTLYG
jgi:hypothetical protein